MDVLSKDNLNFLLELFTLNLEEKYIYHIDFSQKDRDLSIIFKFPYSRDSSYSEANLYLKKDYIKIHEDYFYIKVIFSNVKFNNKSSSSLLEIINYFNIDHTQDIKVCYISKRGGKIHLQVFLTTLQKFKEFIFTFENISLIKPLN